MIAFYFFVPPLILKLFVFKGTYRSTGAKTDLRFLDNVPSYGLPIIERPMRASVRIGGENDSPVACFDIIFKLRGVKDSTLA